jgi:hypothetical protein
MAFYNGHNAIKHPKTWLPRESVWILRVQKMDGGEVAERQGAAHSTKEVLQFLALALIAFSVCKYKHSPCNATPLYGTINFINQNILRANGGGETRDTLMVARYFGEMCSFWLLQPPQI